MSAMLFDELPRDKRRTVRMHVVDAGGDYDVHMQCQRCGYDDGWTNLEHAGLTISDAKRGLPCPKCNAEPTP